MAAVVRPLAVYAAALAVAVALSHAVLGPLDVSLDAGPLFGEWRPPRRWPWLLLPGCVGALVLWQGPRQARSLPWARLVLLSGAAAAAWGVALAATDGWDRLTAPVTTSYEYEPFAATIEDPARFLRTFADDLPRYPVHVQGHPPGAPLVPWALDRSGLDGAGWFAALLVGAWGVAVGAVLCGVRATGGEGRARRAAPALVVLPAAIWAVTSMDAVFAAVLATGVALAVRPGRPWVVGGGTVLGIGLLGTYGGALFVLVAAGVLLWNRRVVDAAVVALAAGSVLVATWALTGFWWLDGLDATRDAYWAGIASRRPSAFLTLVGNPAALAFALGPAGTVGILRAARRPARHVLPVAVALAVAAADASLLSKGEVERIWLPFAVWIAAAAPGDDRRWLAAQVVLAVGLQAALRTAW